MCQARFLRYFGFLRLRGIVGNERKKRKKVAVKYDDGKGNTWTERGMAPRWLVAAEKSGKKRQSFAV